MNTSNPHATIRALLEESIKHLETTRWFDLKQVEQLRAIPVNINTRRRTVSGMCLYTRNPYTKLAIDIRLEFSHHYMERATVEEMRNTVAHEYAHALHVLRSGSTDHSFMWKSIHSALGGNASRTHMVEVKKNKVQRHKIIDRRDGYAGKTYTVSTRRWNHLMNHKSLVGGALVNSFSLIESFTK